MQDSAGQVSLVSTPLDGWIPANETWTYSSADAPTFVLTSNIDVSSKYSLGMKIKYTQNGATVYGIITAISGSTITFYGGTDYTTGSAAITAPFYSMVKAPYGFPLNPTKWTVETSNTSLQTQTSPGDTTWYNMGSISITIPIGVWRTFYNVNVLADGATSVLNGVFATLSTGSATESDVDFTVYEQTSAVKHIGILYTKEKVLTLATKTIYYLNVKVPYVGSSASVYEKNAEHKLFIRAVCAYL